MDFEQLQVELERELTGDIMPWWMGLEDVERGGFYGRVDGEGRIYRDAERGGVLASRVAWTAAAAGRVTGREEYVGLARRAVENLVRRFYDHQNGGIYWSVDADGTPRQTKKQFYALGFAVYALSEYVRLTGDKEALDYAIALYRDIERHSWEPVWGGYIEALDREWQPLADVRLSEKDAPERKTMNTHLHILEPYTNLYRVWPTAELRASLGRLIELFLDRIIDPETGHLKLFFTDDWRSTVPAYSYGHDIEASWLLYEAAEIMGDAGLMERVAKVCGRIAQASAEGLQGDGSLIYEHNFATGATDFDRHWWVQAEAVVGFVNAWQRTGDGQYLAWTIALWEYIRGHLLNPAGEWWWSIRSDGTVNNTDDRAGFWKCPYHNGRMCLEIMERKI